MSIAPGVATMAVANRLPLRLQGSPGAVAVDLVTDLEPVNARRALAHRVSGLGGRGRHVVGLEVDPVDDARAGGSHKGADLVDHPADDALRKRLPRWFRGSGAGACPVAVVDVIGAEAHHGRAQELVERRSTKCSRWSATRS